MEILKIVEALQGYSEDTVAYKLDSRFAFAVTEAVRLLVEQGERLAELEARHDGYWADRYGGKYDNPTYECSECKKAAGYKWKIDELGHYYFVQELTNFCPNCGAKMVGEGKDNG